MGGSSGELDAEQLRTDAWWASGGRTVNWKRGALGIASVVTSSQTASCGSHAMAL